MEIDHRSLLAKSRAATMVMPPATAQVSQYDNEAHLATADFAKIGAAHELTQINAFISTRLFNPLL
jgi:hypothetical protein